MSSPGISVSYLLLLMGIYDEMMRAVSEFYLPFLLPLGAGLILGIVLITKALEYALTRRPHPTLFYHSRVHHWIHGRDLSRGSLPEANFCCAP